jgi:hypothetical protein
MVPHLAKRPSGEEVKLRKAVTFGMTSDDPAEDGGVGTRGAKDDERVTHFKAFGGGGRSPEERKLTY